MATSYEATLFAADDVTPLLGTVDGSGNITQASFSTDPAHPRPYLEAPDNMGEASIDLLNGAAEIGQLNIEVGDVPVTPGDQDSGIVTALLAAAGGQPQTIGHRLLVQLNIDGTRTTMMNGIVGNVKLTDDFSAYKFSLRDMRERDRLGRLFTSAYLRDGIADPTHTPDPKGNITSAPTVLPRGTFDSYGDTFGTSNAVVPATGYYDSARHVFRWNAGKYKRDDLRSDQLVTSKMLKVTEARRTYDNTTGSYAGFFMDQVSVLWRAAGTGSPWNEIKNVNGGHLTDGEKYKSNLFFTEKGKFQGQDANGIKYIYVDGTGTLPTNGQAIDFIVVYTGAPCDEYPLHFSGNAATILKDICDGKYSDAGVLRIPYNAARLTALALVLPTLRARIKKIEPDRRKWLQENWYKPLGSAPALDADGKLSPVLYALPDASVSLLTLDNSNSEPISSWGHEGSNAITQVNFTGIAETYYTADADPFMELSDGDGYGESPVEMQFKHATVVSMDERSLDIKPVTVRAWSVFLDIDPTWTGDIGTLAFAAKTRAFDRFSMGGQVVVVRSSRSATGVAAAKVGDWCLLQQSWMPDYSTQRRGLNRLAQIVAIKDLDPDAREFTCEDAGPSNTPVGVPTLGSITVDADGSFTVPVTAIAAGSEAVVQYAIGVSAPAADSGSWATIGRLTAPGSLKTPPNILNQTVWFHARGEALGRRPSNWTTPVSASSGTVPQVYTMELQRDGTTGAVKVTWSVSTITLGLMVYFQAHAADTPPNPSLSTNVDASLGSYTFGLNETNNLNESFTVDLEPYPGWTGTLVLGTPGKKMRRTLEVDPSAALYLTPTVRLEGKSLYVFPNRSVAAKSVKYFAQTGSAPTLAQVRAGTVSAADSFIAYTFAAIGTTVYVGLLPYQNADGTGLEGESAFVSYAFDQAEVGPYFSLLRPIASGYRFNAIIGQVKSAVPVAGTLYVWLNRGAVASPDPTAAADTFKAFTTNTVFDFDNATVFNNGIMMLDAIQYAPGKTKYVWLEFVDSLGRSTGKQQLALKDALDILDDLGELASGAIKTAAQFALTIIPPEVVSSLPGLPNAAYPIGRIVVLTSDGKLYRNVGGAWSKAADGADIVANSIVAGTLAAGAISSSAMFVSGILLAAAIATDAITTAKIQAGAVTAGKITVGSLSAIQADLGTITAGLLQSSASSPLAAIRLNSGYSLPGTAVQYLDLAATGSAPFLHHPLMDLNADGTAVFRGSVHLVGDVTTYSALIFEKPDTFQYGAIGGAWIDFGGGNIQERVTLVNRSGNRIWQSIYWPSGGYHDFDIQAGSGGSVNIGSGSGKLIFFAIPTSATVGQQTITGSRSSGAALVSLLTAFANWNMITDSTTS